MLAVPVTGPLRRFTTQTGIAPAYKAGAAAVDVAASFPLPSGGSCAGLGIEMVDNMDPIEPEGESACKVDIKWEVVYAAMAIDGLNGLGASRVRLLCVVAAPEGVAFLERAAPEAEVFTAALDRELNGHKYILPGLGDFGDRLFGT